MEEKNKNSQIVRELKYGMFVWDDETKELWIYIKDRETDQLEKVILNKAYCFALMRFILRIAQRNWFRKRPTFPKKNGQEN